MNLIVLIDSRKFIQHDSVRFIKIFNLLIISFVILLHNFLDMEDKESKRVHISKYQLVYLLTSIFCFSVVIILLIIIENSSNILSAFLNNGTMEVPSKSPL